MSLPKIVSHDEWTATHKAFLDKARRVYLAQYTPEVMLNPGTNQLRRNAIPLVQRGKQVVSAKALFVPNSDGTATATIDNMDGVNTVMVTAEPYQPYRVFAVADVMWAVMRGFVAAVALDEPVYDVSPA